MKIIFLGYKASRFDKSKPEPDNNSFYTFGWNAKRARILKKFYPEYEIEVWRFSKSADRYYQKRIEDIEFKMYPAVGIKYLVDVSIKGLKDLLKLSKKEPILISLSQTHNGLAYLISFLFRKSLIIVEDYGEIPPQVKILSKNPLKKVLYKFYLFVEKLVFKNIDFFYLADVNSVSYIKEVYHQFKGEPCVIPVNEGLFYPVSKIEARQKLGWDLNKKYILYVGRLEQIKNVAELIYIWEEIKKEMPEVELVFIGGIETDPFFNLAKEKKVKMYPRKMNIDLPIYYSAADVYVLVGLDNLKFGGLGVAPTESLSCGTPVVSSNLRNIVGGSLQGIGEAPQTLEGHKEAIIKVLKSPENYTRCRDIIIKHYTEEAVAKTADLVIKQLSSKYSYFI